MIGWIQGGLVRISLLELSLKGSLAFGTGGGKQNREEALRCDRPVGCLSCLCPSMLWGSLHLQECSCLTEEGRRLSIVSWFPFLPPQTDLRVVSHALLPRVPGRRPTQLLEPVNTQERINHQRPTFSQE